jgi:predicted ATPase
MPSYILTGTPGAGKTAVLRQLEILGYAVVEEAATDVIALSHALGNALDNALDNEEPGREREFVDKIVALQRQRQRQNSVAVGGDTIVFFDRSPACTLALSRYLGLDASPLLAGEVRRVLGAAAVAKESIQRVRRSPSAVIRLGSRRVAASRAMPS